MTSKLLLPFVLLISIIVTACSGPNNKNSGVVTQLSLAPALTHGVYTTNYNVADIGRHGDFAVGVLGNMQGLLIGLNGNFFSATNDQGKLLPLNTKVALAVTTQFTPSKSFKIKNMQGLDTLKKFINQKISSANYINAIKLHGKFNVVFHSKPVLEVSNKTKLHKAFKVTGTLVGFRMPKLLSNISLPQGFQLFFLSDDHKLAGAVDKLSVLDGTLAIDSANKKFSILFPTINHYQTAMLSNVKKA